MCKLFQVQLFPVDLTVRQAFLKLNDVLVSGSEKYTSFLQSAKHLFDKCFILNSYFLIIKCIKYWQLFNFLSR